MTQQGIYVGPDNIKPNRDRVKSLGLYLINFEISGEVRTILVRATSPGEAIIILNKEYDETSIKDIYLVIDNKEKGILLTKKYENIY